MHRRQQTIFSVEGLQPDWLSSLQLLQYRKSFELVVGLFFGLPVGLFFGLLVGLFAGPVVGLLVGLLMGLLMSQFGPLSKDFSRSLNVLNGGDLNVSFDEASDEIRPVEVVEWSWKDMAIGLVYILCIELFMGLLSMPAAILFYKAGTPLDWLLTGQVVGLLVGLLFVLLGGPSRNQLVKRTDLSPNEGIRWSERNGLLFGLLGSLIGALLIWLLLRELVGLLIGLLIGGGLGFFLGMFFGLGAFIQHYVLRFWLWRTNSLPWNLILFLDEAAKRLFLHKVGGNYIFVHRLLLEHFITLDEPELVEGQNGEGIQYRTQSAQPSLKRKTPVRRKHRRKRH